MSGGAGHRARVGALVAAGGTVLVALIVVLWNTQNHQARIGIGWLVAAVVVAIATWLDLRSLPRSVISATLIVATAWLYLAGLATVMVIVFGWVFAVFGVFVGMPVTGLAWLCRRRVVAGRTDGAVVVVAMLAATGVVALSRPWTPSSAEWEWAAGIAFAGAAVALLDLVRRRGSA